LCTVASRVIAIDGPAGAGKSTTAEAVAEALGIAHLDSGALYRAVTLAGLDAGIPLCADTIVSLAHSLPVRLALVRNGFRPEIAGVDVTRAVRSERVTAEVSQVAAIPEVREWANRELWHTATQHPEGVVSDGRDIGTVVFPDAALKVFLTATSTERTRRRARQVGMAEEPEQLSRLAGELQRRDDLDSSREVAPLVPATDAMILDTTGMRFEDQVAKIVSRARKLFK
jgi:cytidylate kinase